MRVESPRRLQQELEPARKGYYVYRSNTLSFVPFSDAKASQAEKQAQKQRFLFIDRDGTLIDEPPDGMIDSLNKLKIKDDVLAALQEAQANGYKLVIISNQPGLGTGEFPTESFLPAQTKLMETLEEQGICVTDAVFCPHFESEPCPCRKPSPFMLEKYLDQCDPATSYVVGDRGGDKKLAQNLRLAPEHGLVVGENERYTWKEIPGVILSS
jgi:imidazoleglycerol-phosphate dehydratase/histidinol-phosphatase